MEDRDIVILGPTCCWKSEAALEIAESIGAEIVSCDSMQIYRGLEIGTAQPTADQLARVRHHLIGTLDIHEPYDVNVFLGKAKGILADIHGRGKMAVVAGGTGMYAKALVYGHSLLPADASVLEDIRRQMDTAEGRLELEREIMAAAGSKEAVPADVFQNPRHLARALEITRLTGRPPWLHAKAPQAPLPQFIQFVLLPDLDLLKERIRRRTAGMLQAGWIEEAQRAIGMGLMETPTARQALGYREIAEFLSESSSDMEDLQLRLVSKTIHYARRQLTWFRHQHPGAVFIPVSSKADAISAIKKNISIQKEIDWP